MNFFVETESFSSTIFKIYAPGFNLFTFKLFVFSLTITFWPNKLNTTSLLIADKFVLLASGSTSLTDGGIIIQNAAGGIGTAFFVEASSTGAYGRFAVTGSLFAGANSATADEFMVTAKQAAGLPSAAPTYGDTGNGYGNMYINSTTSDIFIYA